MKPLSDFLSAGHLYVYFTYGMHFCCNIVCGKEGFGSGALIRAVEPLSGIGVLRSNRNVQGKNLTNGPAKLCQALDINLELNGHCLTSPPLKLVKRPVLRMNEIVTDKRIGISKSKEAIKRFYIKNNPYVSIIKNKEAI